MKQIIQHKGITESHVALCLWLAEAVKVNITNQGVFCCWLAKSRLKMLIKYMSKLTFNTRNSFSLWQKYKKTQASCYMHTLYC